MNLYFRFTTMTRTKTRQKNKQMQKWMTAAMIVPLLIGIPAEKCRASELTQLDTSIPVQAGARIAVVSKNTRGQYWSLLKAGMKDALMAVNTSYGFEKNDRVYMTFEGPDDEQKIGDQINTIDEVLNENPDVLCLCVSDSNSCTAQIEAAVENGIPVVVFDSNVSNPELITAYRGTDNLRVGELAAEQLAEAIQEKGSVAVFSVQNKTESAQMRLQGFSEKLEDYPKIQIAAAIGQDEVENMADAMKDILEHTTDLKGVFCSNADMSELYLSLDAQLREGIAMVGVDATTRQQEAVLSGEEYCVISQDPKTLGYETILTAVMATAPEGSGADIEKEILLPPQMINSDNIFNPLLYNYVYSE